MGQPGLVTAAALIAARASSWLRAGGFIGGMGKAKPGRASQCEAGSVSQAKSICVPYLGNRLYTSKARINQSHCHDPLPGATSTTGIEEISPHPELQKCLLFHEQDMANQNHGSSLSHIALPNNDASHTHSNTSPSFSYPPSQLTL